MPSRVWSRDFVAFLVGTAVFFIVPLSDFVPLFDPVLPDLNENTMLFFYVQSGWAAAVGAAVVLIAGRPAAWGAAVASALAGNVLWSLFYEVALAPPSQGGFGVVSAAENAVFVFLLPYGPAAAVGGALAAFALATAGSLRGFARRRRGIGRSGSSASPPKP